MNKDQKIEGIVKYPQKGKATQNASQKDREMP